MKNYNRIFELEIALGPDIPLKIASEVLILF